MYKQLKLQIKNFDENTINIIKTFPRPTLFFILSICLISFFVRLSIFPYDIPITLDAGVYFWYAMDMKILEQVPTNYTFANNGWPTFLSFFFSEIDSNRFLDYMNFQRFLSLSISIITIPLVFLLCKKFVSTNYSLIATTIFALEPRMILNSVLGITESLFVLLITCMLLFFFHKKSNYIYAAFAAAAFCAIVRYEGLLLIVPLSISFFIKNREKKSILKFCVVIGVFILIIIPIAYIRIESTGHDGLISHVSGGVIHYQNIIESGEDGQERLIKLFGNGLKNLILYSGWISIPILLFFVPMGIFLAIKNRNSNTTIIFIFTLTLLIPIFYAYSRDIQETRYFLSLLPIFCIFSSLTIKKIMEKTNLRIILATILILGIIFSSIIFVDFKKINTTDEMALYSIAKVLTNISKGTNDNTPIVKYYSAAILEKQEFPNLRKNIETLKPKIIDSNGFSTIDEYIKFGKENGLTHLVVDGKNEKNILNELYLNSDNYPYLIEHFDSSIKDINIKVRIFKIDYENFEKIISK